MCEFDEIPYIAVHMMSQLFAQATTPPQGSTLTRALAACEANSCHADWRVL